MTHHLKTVHHSDLSEKQVADLFCHLIVFFDRYGTSSVLGTGLSRIIGIDGEASAREKVCYGQMKTVRLLRAAGYGNDAMGFFTGLIREIERSPGESIRINGVIIPQILLTWLMEMIYPGHGFVDILTIDRLERETGRPVQKTSRENIEKVIETYPVRLSRHVIRQSRTSRHIARQYLPFEQELDPDGLMDTWSGQFKSGIIEQMYQNRVIFLLNMTCPVYCRFCFRKHKSLRREKNPGIDEIRVAVGHVARSQTIKEVLITGGDPLLSRACLEEAIRGLSRIDHLRTIRVGTRAISYYPQLLHGHDRQWMTRLKAWKKTLENQGQYLEIATHFIHPDEISVQSLEIISDLTRHGIPVYVQTPLLGGCNDDPETLRLLFSRLKASGAGIHYIFMPCHPIQGNQSYRTDIQTGLDTAKQLRACLSDRAMPKICTATRIGKIDWHSSGWAVEPDETGKRIWIRTPFTRKYYASFVHFEPEPHVRDNPEGTLDVQLFGQAGDTGLFLGNRPQPVNDAEPAPQISINDKPVLLCNEDISMPSVVSTGVKGVKRLHQTRVELALDLMSRGGMDKAMGYTEQDIRITDIVISGSLDPLLDMDTLIALLDSLRGIPHVTLVRIRDHLMIRDPRVIKPSMMDALESASNFEVASPFRLEIEVWVTRSNQVGGEQDRLSAEFRSRGIGVYANCPIISGVNDTPDTMVELAGRLRHAGIEFHHVYAAGLPVQDQRNMESPLSTSTLIDIASAVRRYGSGREIPKFMLATGLGEADYGLTSKVLPDSEGIMIRLECYDLAYFTGLDPDFPVPAHAVFDKGYPVISIQGVTHPGSFSL